MNIRRISKKEFETLFGKYLEQASFELRSDISLLWKNLKQKSVSSKNKQIIEIFLENAALAHKEKRGICQDTGYVQIYLELGRDTVLDFDFEESVNATVERVYRKLKLRKSMAHPITRENTQTNTPAFIDVSLSKEKTTRIWILLKGGGSENITHSGFLLPTADRNEIEEWVVEAVKQAGAKGCPPYLVGVGIGGNLAKAVAVSKRLLLNRIDETYGDNLEKDISQSLLEKINRLPIGFQGLRFGVTAMDVQVKTIPCHIATLPIAVSLGCNAVRQAYFEIK